jgi:transposase-like protein
LFEKSEVAGYNTGNSRNGSYSKDFATKFGTLHLSIPRDRLNQFISQFVPKHTRRSDELEHTITYLYQKGITSSEIAELVEKMFGKKYSRATISKLTDVLVQEVESFQKRELQINY